MKSRKIEGALMLDFQEEEVDEWGFEEDEWGLKEESRFF